MSGGKPSRTRPSDRPRPCGSDPLYISIYICIYIYIYIYIHVHTYQHIYIYGCMSYILIHALHMWNKFPATCWCLSTIRSSLSRASLRSTCSGQPFNSYWIYLYVNYTLYIDTSSIHLSIYIYLSIYPSTRLSICLSSIYLTIYPSISIYPSMYLSISLHLYVSISTFFFLSIYLSIYLSALPANRAELYNIYVRMIQCMYMYCTPL